MEDYTELKNRLINKIERSTDKLKDNVTISESNDVLDLKVDLEQFSQYSKPEMKELLVKNTEKYFNEVKKSSKSLHYESATGKETMQISALLSVVELLKTEKEYTNYLELLDKVKDQLTEYEKQVILYNIHTYIELNSGLKKMLHILSLGIALGLGIPTILLGNFIGGLMFVATGALFKIINDVSYQDNDLLFNFLSQVEGMLDLKYDENTYFNVVHNDGGIVINNQDFFIKSFRQIKYSRYKQENGHSYKNLVAILKEYNNTTNQWITENTVTDKALNGTLETAKSDIEKDLIEICDMLLEKTISFEDNSESFVIPENKILFEENSDYILEISDKLRNIANQIGNYNGHNEIILSVLMQYDDLLSQIFKLKDLDNDVFIKTISNESFKSNMTTILAKLEQELDKIKYLVDLEITTESNEFLDALNNHFEVLNNDVDLPKNKVVFTDDNDVVTDLYDYIHQDKKETDIVQTYFTATVEGLIQESIDKQIQPKVNIEKASDIVDKLINEDIEKHNKESENLVKLNKELDTLKDNIEIVAENKPIVKEADNNTNVEAEIVEKEKIKENIMIRD